MNQEKLSTGRKCPSAPSLFVIQRAITDKGVMRAFYQVPQGYSIWPACLVTNQYQRKGKMAWGRAMGTGEGPKDPRLEEEVVWAMAWVLSSKTGKARILRLWGEGNLCDMCEWPSGSETLLKPYLVSPDSDVLWFQQRHPKELMPASQRTALCIGPHLPPGMIQDHLAFYWLHQATWPTSSWGFSCLCLPSYHGCTGIIDTHYCLT